MDHYTGKYTSGSLVGSLNQHISARKIGKYIFVIFRGISNAANMSIRCRYFKEEIMTLTDEIEHIHTNIKNKIDAEVQASEMMDAMEIKANKSLDRIANSIAPVSMGPLKITSCASVVNTCSVFICKFSYILS